MRYIVCFAVVVAFVLVSAFSEAQERAATGNLHNEASWTALKNLVDAANNRASIALTLAEAIRACGMRGMVYAPGTAGADGQGCAAVVVSTTTPPPAVATNRPCGTLMEHGEISLKGDDHAPSNCASSGGAGAREVYQCFNGTIRYLGCTTFRTGLGR